MSELSEQQPMYSPHLKKVLKSYRTAAMTSLNGPNSCLGVWAANKLIGVDEPVAKPKGVPLNSGKKNAPPSPHDAPNAAGCATANGDYDPFLAPPPFPIQQLPILTAPDQSRSERSETVLEGAIISCFVVGGEKRLCLPQILNSVLRDFSLHQINAVCDELQIFCSRCNREQLDVLKVTGVLPFSAPSCGLITKTDAERLCSALLYRHPVILVQSEKKSNSLKVYHECFGKCKGLFSPDEYSSPGALCIECIECHGHFSPQKFVCHAHKALEKRTCHWGFDSANWRAYVLVAKDQPNMERLESQLDEMKGRYCDDYGNKYKRKQYEQEEKDLNKKVKYGEDSASNAAYMPYMYDPVLAYWYSSASAPWSRVSAFRPWSPVVGKDGKPSMTHPLPQQTAFLRDSTIPQPLPPFLSQGPPVLLNPERVVPISETERFERHYQPNVALAPPSAQQVSQKLPAITGSAKVNAIDQQAEKRIENKMLAVNSEMEMSTDTDETLSDSTISAESSADYVPEGVTSDKCAEELSHSSSDEDVEALRKLMEANSINSRTLEEVMREVEKLRKKYKEQLAIALNDKKSLQQEIEFLKISKKEKLREASEGKRHLRKQLEQTREEHAAQMKDALKVQKQLRAQLEEARSNKETPSAVKVESGEKKAKKREGRNRIRSSFADEMISPAERIIKVEVDASPSSSE